MTGRELPFRSRADSCAIIPELEINPSLSLNLLHLVANSDDSTTIQGLTVQQQQDLPSLKVSASLLWLQRTDILGLCCSPTSD